MDVSGQMKVLLWFQGSSQDWQTVYTVPKSQCDAYATCGPFTVCNDVSSPSCSCMKGYSIRSPQDWEVGDRSARCARNTPLYCNSNSSGAGGETDKFYPMASVQLLADAQNIGTATAKNECSLACLRELLVHCVLLRSRCLLHLARQDAQCSGTREVGARSFGSVFEGSLSNSTAIAVKRLDGLRQGEKKFRAEVSSTGFIQHVNLVKLIGFCCQGDTRLLVYEYMPNGSLDSHLFQSNGMVLDWTTSYGMVLLEIVSGSRKSSKQASSQNGVHEGYFPVRVARSLVDGDVASLVDAKLLDEVNLEEVERVCKVACWCIQDDELDRPTMTEVVRFLECLSEVETPPVPRLLQAIAGQPNLKIM
ncbi:G-type lectin S-receptor-like serine/threonine-protein kinase [Hordeum vulgare]|nr:G-type lectin S-receptor-like serine/threonine-protein kinase [Hordeum vulgare]